MQGKRAFVGLLVAAGLSAAGCNHGVMEGQNPLGSMQGRTAYNLPPAERLMEPGPGVGGPGPGVIPPMGGGMANMGGMMNGGAVLPAAYCGSAGCGCAGGGGGYGGGMGGPVARGMTSQIAFLGGDGVMISWDVSGPGMFDSVPLVVPGRQDFQQGPVYRLRLSNIPGRAGVELFPTLEVAPVTPRTDAFLAHSPIPVQFTEEDFAQAMSGNYVTKVIYLPDPEFQELSLSGVATLVSTRLDPGVDPISEADYRGSILAIVRMGNKVLTSDANAAGAGPGGVVHAAYQTKLLPADVPLDDFDIGSYEPVDGGAPYVAKRVDGGAPYVARRDNMNYSMGGGVQGVQMPMGMPAAGFAPAAMPPQMIPGGPTWGMPITGTPLGLPGPPHIPLGSPAGLRRHVMHNRTRVAIPPPVTQMTMSVKQRPGMNYPQPVNSVQVDEVHREPGGLIPNVLGWLNGN